MKQSKHKNGITTFVCQEDLTPELYPLQPVLKAWGTAIKAYLNQTPDKCIWSYRERTWVGFLAAGAWLAKGVALEEWVTDKWRDGGRKSKGRADLYIGIAGRHFDFEAKHGFWRINPKTFGLNRISKLKLDAEISTSGLQTEGGVRLQTVFASVRFAKKIVTTLQKRKLFKKALENVNSRLKPDAMAYAVDANSQGGIVLFLWMHAPTGK